MRKAYPQERRRQAGHSRGLRWSAPGWPQRLRRNTSKLFWAKNLYVLQKSHHGVVGVIVSL